MTKGIRSFCIFIAACSAAGAFAQPVPTAVSASDPYGVDFSKVAGRPALVAEYRGSDLDCLVLRSMSNYDKGHLTSTQLFDEDGDLKSSARYTYTASGQLTEIAGSDAGRSDRWKYSYAYDAYGRLKEESSFTAAGVLEWKAVSTYNARGLLISRITYDSSDTVTLKESFKYNDRGFIYADITQFPDGKVLKRIIYTYTAGGHVAFEDHYDNTGFYEQVGYSYTDGGDITSFSSVDKKGKLKSRTLLSYGLSGKIEHEKIYNEDGTLSVDITYTYDSRGNWIWKYDGKIYTLRKIIYGEQ